MKQYFELRVFVIAALVGFLSKKTHKSNDDNFIKKKYFFILLDII